MFNTGASSVHNYQPLKLASTNTTFIFTPLWKIFLPKSHPSQEKTAVENIARYLLTVRAEYLFLVILHYTHMEDHNRVQMEYEDFCRYVYTPQGLL